MLRALTAAAALAALVLIGAIAWKIVAGAWPAIDEFGLGFLVSRDWNPVTGEFGALQFVVGTIVTSFGAVLLAGPISIAIGLFLSELAPPAVRTPIGTLIEMLAAIPSVVIGLWGIFVFGPWVATHLEPALNDVSAGCRSSRAAEPERDAPGDPRPDDHDHPDHVLAVPRALRRRPARPRGGRVALGATRWEMVRGVVLPYARGGVVAAVILGLGRALGEAIAVTQVIGNSDGLHRSLFAPGDTLASRLANQYQGAVDDIQVASLFYLALILLAITLVTNLAGRRIVRRFELQRTGGG